jgi:hypothetical protein
VMLMPGNRLRGEPPNAPSMQDFQTWGILFLTTDPHQRGKRILTGNANIGKQEEGRLAVFACRLRNRGLWGKLAADLFPFRGAERQRGVERCKNLKFA